MTSRCLSCLKILSVEEVKGCDECDFPRFKLLAAEDELPLQFFQRRKLVYHQPDVRQLLMQVMESGGPIAEHIDAAETLNDLNSSFGDVLAAYQWIRVQLSPPTREEERRIISLAPPDSRTGTRLDKPEAERMLTLLRHRLFEPLTKVLMKSIAVVEPLDKVSHFLRPYALAPDLFDRGIEVQRLKTAFDRAADAKLAREIDVHLQTDYVQLINALPNGIAALSDIKKLAYSIHDRVLATVLAYLFEGADPRACYNALSEMGLLGPQARDEKKALTLSAVEHRHYIELLLQMISWRGWRRAPISGSDQRLRQVIPVGFLGRYLAPLARHVPELVPWVEIASYELDKSKDISAWTVSELKDVRLTAQLVTGQVDSALRAEIAKQSIYENLRPLLGESRPAKRIRFIEKRPSTTTEWQELTQDLGSLFSQLRGGEIPDLAPSTLEAMVQIVKSIPEGQVVDRGEVFENEMQSLRKNCLRLILLFHPHPIEVYRRVPTSFSCDWAFEYFWHRSEIRMDMDLIDALLQGNKALIVLEQFLMSMDVSKGSRYLIIESEFVARLLREGRRLPRQGEALARFWQFLANLYRSNQKDEVLLDFVRCALTFIGDEANDPRFDFRFSLLNEVYQQWRLLNPSGSKLISDLFNNETGFMESFAVALTSAKSQCTTFCRSLLESQQIHRHLNARDRAQLTEAMVRFFELSPDRRDYEMDDFVARLLTNDFQEDLNLDLQKRLKQAQTALPDYAAKRRLLNWLSPTPSTNANSGTTNPLPNPTRSAEELEAVKEMIALLGELATRLFKEKMNSISKQISSDPNLAKTAAEEISLIQADHLALLAKIKNIVARAPA